MHVADIDNDGYQDLLMGLASYPGGYGGLQIRLNDGNGSFTEIIDMPIDFNVGSIALGMYEQISLCLIIKATKYIADSIEDKNILILTKNPIIGGNPATDKRTVAKKWRHMHCTAVTSEQY